ncbi:unnamed protein product, partial [marine sediment metagenome]
NSPLIRTGITAAAAAKYLRGPGILYKDFVDLGTLGTPLGETKGGSTFSYGLSFHDVEPDGAMGWVVGHRFIEKVLPTLAVSLLEHSVNEYLRHLPGANSANQQPTGIKGEYIGTGAEVDVGVAPGGSPNIDESTLEVWRTPVALGLGVKLALTTDYNVVDTVTMDTVVAADTVTIGGDTFTGDDTPVQADGEFETGVSDTSSATSLAALINSEYGVTGVSATSADEVVSLSRAVSGTKNVMSSSGATIDLAYQVVLATGGGAVLDDDEITVFYVYDSVAADTYTVIKTGQIATGDYLTNVALLCEVSDASQTYPIVFIIKNPLSEPDTIDIPGERMSETLLKTTWTGFFDPADGLDLDQAPVEVWVPYGI